MGGFSFFWRLHAFTLLFLCGSVVREGCTSTASEGLLPKWGMDVMRMRATVAKASLGSRAFTVLPFPYVSRSWEPAVVGFNFVSQGTTWMLEPSSPLFKAVQSPLMKVKCLQEEDPSKRLYGFSTNNARTSGSRSGSGLDVVSFVGRTL